MKWLAGLNREVLGSLVKHFLLFFFISNIWDPVKSFRLGSDMIRFIFMQQFSIECEGWT